MQFLWSVWQFVVVLWNDFLIFAQLHWITVLIDAVLTSLTLYPLFDFFLVGWKRRASEISTCLNSRAKCLYLQTFQQYIILKISPPINTGVQPKTILASEAPEEFDRFYQDWYGRRYFIIPIFFVFVVAVIENHLLAESLLDLQSTGTKEITIAAGAIAGAYTFVTWEFFARMQRRDLSRADILRGALRLAMALPLGFAFGGLSKDFGPFLAFAIGVFPFQMLIIIIRRWTNKTLKLEIGADTSVDQVKTLAGIDASTADRIADADITTITQLAWCDPIQLTMRANLQLNYVLDIVSQALAWVYLEDKLNALRPLGLRGAIEIRILLDDLKKGNAIEKRRARAVVPVASKEAKIAKSGLLFAFYQIGEDPATEFVDEAR